MNADKIKFSFIIGTLNRANELKYCIKSLLYQTYKELEIIIVDQSDNDLTEKLVKSFDDKRIVYEHVNFRGLSRARNRAISLATGEYICLTDDDAYYDSDYLAALKKHYEKKEDSIISGYMWDAVNKRDFVDYSKLKGGNPLSVREIIRKCPSPAITFPRILVQKIGGFDESFGVGAKYGAAEETDFMLRAVWENYEVFFWPDVKVTHPHEFAEIAVDEAALDRKAYSYPFGTGAMYRKQFMIGDKKRLLFPYTEQAVKMMIKRLLHMSRADIMCRRFWEGYDSYYRDKKEK